MKTTEVPPGAATATTIAQIRSLEARIHELSEEVRALEAKIEAQEKSQAQDAEKSATKLKDLETQIENPKNEEDDTDPELTKWQDSIIDKLWELDPYDEYGPGGEIEKELDDMDSFLKPPPGRPSLFPASMLRRG